MGRRSWSTTRPGRPEMCGRFGLVADSEGVLDYFWFDPSSVEYKQRYNVAPTTPS